MEAVNGVAEGPPPPSPLTGCYLLVVLGEPHTGSHKDIILQRLAKGLLSWNINDCLVDLEKELTIVTEQGLEGEEARYGERLIQFASENLVTEILIHPSVSTLAQCIRNLLSSFTRHRHIIHAGYTFGANGSWILQDGTFSLADFSEAFQEVDVQRVIRAYENGISLDIHCSSEGEWIKLPKESFTRGSKVRINPDDVLDSGSPAIANFLKYIEPFLVPAELESTLESSDVVGNIRFSRPTLYVFPGGQGDAALFGINGFNMLVDGGFSRKACFWDFVRHLDRLDAVMLTRLNNSNTCGIGAVLRRKAQNAVYPQIGHFFCNIQNRKANLSPDGDKDKDPLLVNLLDEGQELISNLRSLELAPQLCYRDSEPINLYHKVGHGTLDMYVINPAKDSREVKEFLLRWNNNDQRLFANHKFSRECLLPLQNIVSICALLVWRPANPHDTITRILFPGSAPQSKIFEGLDRLKNLECIKHITCTEKTLAPTPKPKSKDSILEKIVPPEKPKAEIKKNKIKPVPENKVMENNMKNGLQNGHAEKQVKKSGSVESDKSESKLVKTKKEDVKIIENNKEEKAEKISAKPKHEMNGARTKPKKEKKPSPPTPKKIADTKKSEIDKETANQRVRSRISPSATPAKSTKDANNRKVLESKSRTTAKRDIKETKQPEKKEEIKKVERKPISRRPKTEMKLPQSPVKKMVNGVHKPDSIPKKSRLDKDGTTDSSTVSTPSADQDSLLKKDISKLTPEEVQQLKAQELAELKEEQEAIKELEAVFRKGDENIQDSSDLRKIKDVSIEDKTEPEEYLIVEKEKVEPSDSEIKEEETVKLARDSEESEKKREVEMKEESDKEKQVDLEQEESGIGEQETDQEDAEEIRENEISKEPSLLSPEEIKKITSKEDDLKELAQESQPDEKISANLESGATTTAPTLPEDERIPLNEIKEDTIDHIEEKHVKEETKEKETKEEVPVTAAVCKTSENLAKIPTVVGIRLDKESRIRDIVKTPDEVADLPVHEEADVENLSEYSHERQDKGKLEILTKSGEHHADRKSPEKSKDEVSSSKPGEQEPLQAENVTAVVKEELDNLVKELEESSRKSSVVEIPDRKKSLESHQLTKPIEGESEIVLKQGDIQENINAIKESYPTMDEKELIIKQSEPVSGMEKNQEKSMKIASPTMPSSPERAKETEQKDIIKPVESEKERKDEKDKLDAASKIDAVPTEHVAPKTSLKESSVTIETDKDSKPSALSITEDEAIEQKSVHIEKKEIKSPERTATPKIAEVSPTKETLVDSSIKTQGKISESSETLAEIEPHEKESVRAVPSTESSKNEENRVSSPIHIDHTPAKISTKEEDDEKEHLLHSPVKSETGIEYPEKITSDDQKASPEDTSKHSVESPSEIRSRKGSVIKEEPHKETSTAKTALQKEESVPIEEKHIEQILDLKESSKEIKKLEEIESLKDENQTVSPLKDTKIEMGIAEEIKSDREKASEITKEIESDNKKESIEDSSEHVIEEPQKTADGASKTPEKETKLGDTQIPERKEEPRIPSPGISEKHDEESVKHETITQEHTKPIESSLTDTKTEETDVTIKEEKDRIKILQKPIDTKSSDEILPKKDIELTEPIKLSPVDAKGEQKEVIVKEEPVKTKVEDSKISATELIDSKDEKEESGEKLEHQFISETKDTKRISEAEVEVKGVEVDLVSVPHVENKQSPPVKFEETEVKGKTEIPSIEEFKHIEPIKSSPVDDKAEVEVASKKEDVTPKAEIERGIQSESDDIKNNLAKDEEKLESQLILKAKDIEDSSKPKEEIEEKSTTVLHEKVKPLLSENFEEAIKHDKIEIEEETSDIKSSKEVTPEVTSKDSSPPKIQDEIRELPSEAADVSEKLSKYSVVVDETSPEKIEIPGDEKSRSPSPDMAKKLDDKKTESKESEPIEVTEKSDMKLLDQRLGSEDNTVEAPSPMKFEDKKPSTKPVEEVKDFEITGDTKASDTGDESSERRFSLVDKKPLIEEKGENIPKTTTDMKPSHLIDSTHDASNHIDVISKDEKSISLTSTETEKQEDKLKAADVGEHKEKMDVEEVISFDKSERKSLSSEDKIEKMGDLEKPIDIMKTESPVPSETERESITKEKMEKESKIHEYKTGDVEKPEAIEKTDTKSAEKVNDAALTIVQSEKESTKITTGTEIAHTIEKRDESKTPEDIVETKDKTTKSEADKDTIKDIKTLETVEKSELNGPEKINDSGDRTSLSPSPVETDKEVRKPSTTDAKGDLSEDVSKSRKSSIQYSEDRSQPHSPTQSEINEKERIVSPSTYKKLNDLETYSDSTDTAKKSPEHRISTSEQKPHSSSPINIEEDKRKSSIIHETEIISKGLSTVESAKSLKETHVREKSPEKKEPETEQAKTLIEETEMKESSPMIDDEKNIIETKGEADSTRDEKKLTLGSEMSQTPSPSKSEEHERTGTKIPEEKVDAEASITKSEEQGVSITDRKIDMPQEDKSIKSSTDSKNEALSPMRRLSSGSTKSVTEEFAKDEESKSQVSGERDSTISKDEELQKAEKFSKKDTVKQGDTHFGMPEKIDDKSVRSLAERKEKISEVSSTENLISKGHTEVEVSQTANENLSSHKISFETSSPDKNVDSSPLYKGEKERKASTTELKKERSESPPTTDAKLKLKETEAKDEISSLEFGKDFKIDTSHAAEYDELTTENVLKTSSDKIDSVEEKHSELQDEKETSPSMETSSRRASTISTSETGTIILEKGEKTEEHLQVTKDQGEKEHLKIETSASSQSTDSKDAQKTSIPEDEKGISHEVQKKSIEIDENIAEKSVPEAEVTNLIKGHSEIENLEPSTDTHRSMDIEKTDQSKTVEQEVIGTREHTMKIEECTKEKQEDKIDTKTEDSTKDDLPKIMDECSTDLHDEKPHKHIYSFLEQERIHSHKQLDSLEKQDKSDKKIEDVHKESKEKPLDAHGSKQTNGEKAEDKTMLNTEHIDSNKIEEMHENLPVYEDKKKSMLTEYKEDQKEKGIEEPKEKDESVSIEQNIVKTESIKIDLTDKPEHAESVLLKSTPESPVINIVPSLPVLVTDIDKTELGRKSPKEREEDVAKIVASVATVLKSDAPLEEFHAKVPLATNTPFGGYTTELRETHITTCDSPVKESKTKQEETSNTERSESEIEPSRLMDLESSIILEKDESDTTKADESEDSGTVHRMLVTASSEDGGEETEICPPGTITFSKSSESSGRSSPENISRKLSQTSSVLDTISDQSTVKESADLPTKKEILADEVTKKSTFSVEGAPKPSQGVPTQSIYPSLDSSKEPHNLEDQIEKKTEDPVKEPSEINAILSEALREVSEDAGEIKETVSSKIGSVFENLFSSASKVSEALSHSINDSVKAVESSIDEGLKKVESELVETKHKIETAESHLVKAISDKKEETEHIITDQLKDSMQNLEETLVKTQNAKSSLVQETQDTFKEMSAPLRETLGSTLTNVAAFLKDTEKLESEIEQPAKKIEDSPDRSTKTADQKDTKLYPSLENDLENVEASAELPASSKSSTEATNKITSPTKESLTGKPDSVPESTVREESIAKESENGLKEITQLDDSISSDTSPSQTIDEKIDSSVKSTQDTAHTESDLKPKEMKETNKEKDAITTEKTESKTSEPQEYTKQVMPSVKEDVCTAKNELDSSSEDKNVEKAATDLSSDEKELKDHLDMNIKDIKEKNEHIQDNLEGAIKTTSEKFDQEINNVTCSIDKATDDLDKVQKDLKSFAEKSVDNLKTNIKQKSLDLEKEKDSLVNKLETEAACMINSYTNELENTLKDSEEKVITGSQFGLEDLKSASGDEVSAVADIITEEGGSTVKDAKTVISDISSIVKEELDESLKSLAEIEKNLLKESETSLDKTASSVSDVVQQSHDGISSTIVKEAETILNTGKEEVDKKLSDMKEAVEGTKLSMKEKAESISEDISKTKDKMENMLTETKDDIKSNLRDIQKSIEADKELIISTGEEIKTEVTSVVGDVLESGKKLFGGLFGSKKDKKRGSQDEQKEIPTSEIGASSDISSKVEFKQPIDIKEKRDSTGNLEISKTGDKIEICDISRGDVQTHLDVANSHGKKLSISDVEIIVDEKSKDSVLADIMKIAGQDSHVEEKIAPKQGSVIGDADMDKADSFRKEDRQENTKKELQDNTQEKHITNVPDLPDERNVASAKGIVDDCDSEEKFSSQMDPMSMSFYGALPDDDAEKIDQKASGKGSIITQEHDVPKIPVQDPMTSSFFGELPSDKDDEDPIASWGKPLKLPSPAPPNEKGTPKRERKLPSNVMAKNRMNDDRARSESPSKNKKKINPVYVDLTYVPHHGNANYAYVDFFKRVRARYYVFSGIEPSREVYNALLEAKQTWEDKDSEVTIIPTYDTDVLGYWVAENEDLLAKYKIDLSPSASRCTINLQDHETSCSAYRLEF